MFSEAQRSLQRILFASSLLVLAAAGLAAQVPSPASHPETAAKYGKLPLSFEANQGQAAAGVRFLSRGSGYGLDLTDSGAILSLTHQKSPRAKSKGPAKKLTLTDTIRLQLVGASPQTQAIGTDQLPGVANYMIDNDPSHWHTNLPTYAKVKYTSVYPGVDLVYYGNQSQLEYDFVLAPKANSEAIRLQFAGATRLNLAANGDLQVSAPHGAIAFDHPTIYQLIEGQREPVQGRFKLLANNQVGFALGRYDHSQPLIIDPVLTYSTYLGSLGGNPAAFGAIAIDSTGDAYLAGETASSTFPVTTGSFQSTKKDSVTAFVSKLNPTGTALVYSTYLGGSSNPEFGDEATGITVDSSGDAYLVGITGATNFPVTGNAFQMVNNAAATGGGTVFVTKLNPAGNALVYSTFLGGSTTDEGDSIAIDSAGNAYVTGIAASSDFPVTNGALQLQNGAPATSTTGNAFVTKLDSTGSHLIYSTYLGGKGNIRDYGSGIAVDSAGDAYVTGQASSSDFPVTTGAFQTANNAAASGGTNAFVAKINPTGTALIYSTYLGGNVGDSANGIALDSSNNAYVVGTANSSDFPITTGAFQAANNAATGGGANAFITKINPAGAALLYSTYLGGSGGENGNGITVDLAGDACVIGTTYSSDFPVTNGAFQSVNKQPSGGSTSFISKFNPAGAALLYSTYLGGSGLVGDAGDFGLSIAVDGSGNAYVFGYTGSSDFPVTKGAFDTTFVGSASGGLGSMFFVAKLAIGSTTTPTIPTTTTVTSSANPQIQGTAVTFTSTVTENSGTVTPTGSVAFSVDGTAASTVALNSSGGASYTTSTLTVGPHTILASYGGSETDETSSDSLTETITAAAAATTTSLTSSSPTSDQGTSVTFTATVSSSVTGSITGTVTFYDGTTTLGTGTLTSGAATFSTSSLSVGTHSITATFGGDTLYLTSTSSPLSQVVVTPGITFTANPTTLTVAKGSSGTVVITATPTGGYSGTITFACGTLPADASCTFAPPTLTFTSSSSAQTSTLTFSTKATTSAALTHGPGKIYAPGILAALLLLPLSFRKRLRRLSVGRVWTASLLLLFTITAAAGLLGITGCGASGSNSTPAGTYSVPVTITAGTSTSSLSLTIVVQ
jgi:hypothetical protein